MDRVALHHEAASSRPRDGSNGSICSRSARKKYSTKDCLSESLLAGHIALKVFASFVGMLGALGLIGWIGAIFPLVLTVALTALELLIAFLQAYVFAVLACIYLNDAVHPGH
jgi:hypothetical protein